MQRHDPARTGLANGSSDITEPVPYFRHYLGGALRPLELITADVTQMRLLLDVTAQDSGLRFRFHTGLVASAWGDKDKQWAEGQADAWLASF